MTAHKSGSYQSSFRFPKLYARFAVWAGAALLALLQPMAWAQEAYPQGNVIDPPGRVARLNLIDGGVSFSPADDAGYATGNDWRQAQLNRPLTSGDRLWTGPQARAELYVGSTALRMNEQTSLDIQTLDDNMLQLRLAQGTLRLRVRSLFEGDRIEVNTPNLAFVVSRPGDYRLDVNPSTNTTRVVAQSGSGVIYGDASTAPINLGDQQQASFTGTQLIPATPGAAYLDSFDQWVAERDRLEDQSISARYIPRETLGYQQLDTYGSWSNDPSYGAIWFPRAVPLNWAPYRLGHWDWVSPWGWTWVDDAPWGFAPFHYGRWAQIGPRWAWVPGRLAPRPVYAPALVAFIGGSSGNVSWNIAIGSGGAPRPSLGWFPLAPGEAYRPAYRVSPRYVSRLNNNIVVNNTVNVTNVYRYQREASAVTAISRDDFMRGRPVREAGQRPSQTDLSRAQLLANRSALPQRADAREFERARPAAPAALPPAAVIARPLLRQPERRDELRAGPEDNDRRDRRQGNANDRDDERRQRRSDDNPRIPGALVAPAAPAMTAPPAGAQPPAASPDAAIMTNPQIRSRRLQEERSNPEMEQRNPRLLPPQVRELQTQPQEQSLGQRALREQAQRNAAMEAEARAAANRNAIEQQQQQQQAQRVQEQQLREQQRQQQQAVQQQEEQRRALQAQQRQAQEQQQAQRAQEQQLREQQRLQQQQAVQQQQQLRQQQQEQQRALQAQQRQAQQQERQQEQQRQPGPPQMQQRERAQERQPQQAQQPDRAERDDDPRNSLRRRAEEMQRRNREQ